MQIDASLPPTSIGSVPSYAKAAEELGFDALWSSETTHDPFMPGAMVAEHTHRLKFGTAVAIAFARSPATIAYTAWDLAEATDGRFILGLGTQVKPHIVRRFGMPWPDSVVGKLREQIDAIRALWHTWQTGERINFRGKYYKITLMSPFFNPGPIKHAEIPIYIAGVNTGLARLAGETADGFIVHPLHTRRYLTDVLVPVIEDGAAKAGRDHKEISISVHAFVITSPEEKQFVRAQIAFYASTPSYRPVMALHGWGETAEALSRLAARKKWGSMPDLISDEMLHEFALISDEDRLPEELNRKYSGIVDRMGLYLPFEPGERSSLWRALLEIRG